MRINKVVIGVTLFVLACAGWFFYESPIKDTKRDQPVLPTINNASLAEDVQGKRVWELTIEKMTVDPVSQINTLQGIKGKLYRANGQVLELSAQTGEVDLRSKDIKLVGQVVLSNSEGERLAANELRVDSQKNEIVAKGQAVLNNKQAVAKADEMITDKQFTKTTLVGNASVVKQ